MNGRRKTAVWMLIAMVGGLCGFLATAKRAKACSCVLPAWAVHLKSVTSSDPHVDDSRIWPQEGTLFSDSEASGNSSLSFGSTPGMIEGVVTP